MKTRNRRFDGTHAEMLLSLTEQVTEVGLGSVLCYLIEEATKYSVDKSGEGVAIDALFPDGSFICLVLDDAGYIEKTIMHN